MNPETNKFESLEEVSDEEGKGPLQKFIERERSGELIPPFMSYDPTLVRPDGSPVPKHWSIFTVGENVVIKNYTFKVAYIGESNILFEPVGPIEIGKEGG